MDHFKNQPQLKPYFDKAYGFAVFDGVAKGGIGIGGAVGKGAVYTIEEDGSFKHVGVSKMAQLSWGFQFGGQVYDEIIFFETKQAFEKFTAGNFEFGANANVTALKATASTKASTMGHQGPQIGNQAPDGPIEYSNGAKVFTAAQGGLMYEATISGQKFNYQPITA